jgi:DNA topoisomerase-1
MSKNLVIVESPAKAKTIEGFLGKDFLVKSSFGHIRDLNKKQISVDIKNGFKPEYEIPEDKAKIISELKKLAKAAEMVWLASDEDREGEAISWHLYEALGLKEKNTKRIVFHEITKSAITKAIENPRFIDINLVNAQQARRVLDRLVGYELSPLLWKKIKPALSAGRVQSVAVRLIADREEEIRNFKSSFSYRVSGKFLVKNKFGQGELIAELTKRIPTHDETMAFLNAIIKSSYYIKDTEKKPAKKSPAPPFTTSTLQQEAARKLGFSVSKTMMVAQQLYEEGKITYMRTDSVNLSDTALGMAKHEVEKLFGPEYIKTRNYTTKTKGAQEAHEAIRPTYMNNQTAGSDESQRRLYELIWKRTIASQMSDAILERTTITIGITDAPKDEFVAKGEIIKFDGFLKVYIESTDDDASEDETRILPPVVVGEKLDMESITATQKYTQSPPRYAEASLVKKLEELGIGRPSTYAPIISTIQKREYVVKEDREGIMRPYEVILLKAGRISSENKVEKTGYEKAKLFPTDIGSLVNNYLMNNFGDIMDFNFTAKVEKDFDEIADGNMKWNKMIADFYKPFHSSIEKAFDSTERVKGEKLLGVDPVTGKNIYVKLGRFGPIVQLGETVSDKDEKPKFAGLKKTQSIETISIDDALELLKLPRQVGVLDGKEIVAAVGRFGPYIQYNKAFFSLPKGVDPMTVTVAQSIEIMADKKRKEAEKVIKTFPDRKDIVVLKGRFGPYFAVGTKNIPLPKGTDVDKLTVEACLKIAEDYGNKDQTAKAKSTVKKAEPKAASKAKAKPTAAKEKKEGEPKKLVSKKPVAKKTKTTTKAKPTKK